ncbi:hypothetical protein Pcinc_019238 [Petrolisthes cinctipes]|uniref:Peptidase S1 domain-containing protein n=1 Tax=Petrolisthes cinctipes TaxID=88211 RepID=A0AAE1KMY2_PETCI|nr:hypothetical protein Pcinc_019238 [Petrolisthes cinctipes]
MVDSSVLGYNSPLLAHIRSGMPLRRDNNHTPVLEHGEEGEEMAQVEDGTAQMKGEGVEGEGEIAQVEDGTALMIGEGGEVEDGTAQMIGEGVEVEDGTALMKGEEAEVEDETALMKGEGTEVEGEIAQVEEEGEEVEDGTALMVGEGTEVEGEIAQVEEEGTEVEEETVASKPSEYHTLEVHQSDTKGATENQESGEKHPSHPAEFVTTPDGMLNINVLKQRRPLTPSRYPTPFAPRPTPITLNQAAGIYLNQESLPPRTQTNNAPLYYAVENPDFNQVSQKIHKIVTSLNPKLNDRGPSPAGGASSLLTFTGQQPARPGDTPPTFTNTDGFTGVSVKHMVPEDPGVYDASTTNSGDVNIMMSSDPHPLHLTDLPGRPFSMQTDSTLMHDQQQQHLTWTSSHLTPSSAASHNDPANPDTKQADNTDTLVYSIDTTETSETITTSAQELLTDTNDTHEEPVIFTTVTPEPVTDTTVKQDPSAVTQKSPVDAVIKQESTDDASNKQESTGDASNKQESTGDTSNKQEPTGDTSIKQESTGDTSNKQESTGDTSNKQESTGDTSIKQEQPPSDTAADNQVSVTETDVASNQQPVTNSSSSDGTTPTDTPHTVTEETLVTNQQMLLDNNSTTKQTNEAVGGEGETTTTPIQITDSVTLELYDEDFTTTLAPPPPPPPPPTTEEQTDIDIGEILVQRVEELEQSEAVDDKLGAMEQKYQEELDLAMADLLVNMFDPVSDTSTTQDPPTTVWNEGTQATDEITVVPSYTEVDSGSGGGVGSDDDDDDDKQTLNNTHLTHPDINEGEDMGTQLDLDNSDSGGQLASDGEHEKDTVSLHDDVGVVGGDGGGGVYESESNVMGHIPHHPPLLVDFPPAREPAEDGNGPVFYYPRPTSHQPAPITADQAAGVYIGDKKMYLKGEAMNDDDDEEENGHNNYTTRSDPPRPDDDGLNTWYDRDPISIFDPLHNPQQPGTHTHSLEDNNTPSHLLPGFVDHSGEANSNFPVLGGDQSVPVDHSLEDDNTPSHLPGFVDDDDDSTEGGQLDHHSWWDTTNPATKPQGINHSLEDDDDDNNNNSDYLPRPSVEEDIHFPGPLDIQGEDDGWSKEEDKTTTTTSQEDSSEVQIQLPPSRIPTIQLPPSRIPTSQGFTPTVIRDTGVGVGGEENTTTAFPGAVLHSAQPQHFLKASCRCGLRFSQKIVGGEPTQVDQFPWMVGIARKDDHFTFCGGSIISDRFILTAAHCVSGKQPGDLYVRAGETVRGNPQSITVNVQQIIVHNGYSALSHVKNDIALLKLATSLPYNDRVFPVCLAANGDKFDNEIAVVSGWGRNESGGNTLNGLHEVSVKVLSKENCRQNSLYEKPEVNKKILCASSEGKDACQGDSGGPLVFLNGDHYIQIGIVSWGIGCANINYPGIYTRVGAFNKWIAKKALTGSICKGGLFKRRNNFKNNKRRRRPSVNPNNNNNNNKQSAGSNVRDTQKQKVGQSSEEVPTGLDLSPWLPLFAQDELKMILLIRTSVAALVVALLVTCQHINENKLQSLNLHTGTSTINTTNTTTSKLHLLVQEGLQHNNGGENDEESLNLESADTHTLTPNSTQSKTHKVKKPSSVPKKGVTLPTSSVPKKGADPESSTQSVSPRKGVVYPDPKQIPSDGKPESPSSGGKMSALLPIIAKFNPNLHSDASEDSMIRDGSNSNKDLSKKVMMWMAG